MKTLEVEAREDRNGSVDRYISACRKAIKDVLDETVKERKRRIREGLYYAV